MFDCIGRQKEQDAQVLWPDGGCGRSSEAMRGRRSSEKANRGLSFERWLVCPAGMGAYFCFSLAACAARRMTRCASGSFKRVKLGLSFERRLLRPAGTGAFLFMLFGPPARRAADGGLLGAAAPPRPPLHSPRTTPLSLSHLFTPTGSLQGLSRSHHSARAARLSLRELPRCARRSPCAPRNASVRLRVE